MAGVAGRSGGARPGAGRKSNAEKYKRPISTAERRIADRLPFLIDRMMELAEGVRVLDVNLVTLEESVYQRPPDRQAIQYLVDRIMGKPVERSENENTNTNVTKVVDGKAREALRIVS